ncbi:MAG: YbaB/EbfC family nucleoid-associated protein [Spirochaetes bacterium]|nr:YbaB/EbfC family nucleoid-associated protein [Spirochaetota bacterium]
MLKDLGNMMKLQKELKNVQKSLKKSESSAESQDGLIKVTVNGEFSMVDISIDESLLEAGNRQKLEKQIISTANKAVATAKEYAAKEMGKLTGGMNIPGLDKFFG